jgi:hypothetical protein
MNPDLKMRLKPLSRLNNNEWMFWQTLCTKLGQRALLFSSLHYGGGSKIDIHFEAIENGEDDSAYMLGDDKGAEFDIYLDNRMPFGMVIDFLIHELAHIHSWLRDEIDDHGPEFGKSYAVLYTEYLKLYDEFWCSH